MFSRWCRSCQLDLLSTDQLVWIEPDSCNGAGTGVFTVPGTGMLTVPIGLGQVGHFLQLVSVEHDSVVFDSGRLYSCISLLFLLPSVDLVGRPMLFWAVPTEDYLFLQ